MKAGVVVPLGRKVPKNTMTDGMLEPGEPVPVNSEGARATKANLKTLLKVVLIVPLGTNT